MKETRIGINFFSYNIEKKEINMKNRRDFLTNSFAGLLVGGAAGADIVQDLPNGVERGESIETTRLVAHTEDSSHFEGFFELGTRHTGFIELNRAIRSISNGNCFLICKLEKLPVFDLDCEDYFEVYSIINKKNRTILPIVEIKDNYSSKCSIYRRNVYHDAFEWSTAYVMEVIKTILPDIRNFIGIEKDETYFQIAKQRIEGAQLPLL